MIENKIVYEKAFEYYPLLWKLDRIDALKKANKLNDAEYNSIIKQEYLGE